MNHEIEEYKIKRISYEEKKNKRINVIFPVTHANLKFFITSGNLRPFKC